jgi:hypothetical protein
MATITRSVFIKFVTSLCHNGPYQLEDFAARYSEPVLLDSNPFNSYIGDHYDRACCLGLNSQQLHDLAKRLQSKIIESMRYGLIPDQPIPLEGFSAGRAFSITRNDFIGFVLDPRDITFSRYVVSQCSLNLSTEDTGHYYYADFHYEASLKRQDAPETIVDLAYYIKNQVNQARSSGYQLNTLLTLVPPVQR